MKNIYDGYKGGYIFEHRGQVGRFYHVWNCQGSCYSILRGVHRCSPHGYHSLHIICSSCSCWLRAFNWTRRQLVLWSCVHWRALINEPYKINEQESRPVLNKFILSVLATRLGTCLPPHSDRLDAFQEMDRSLALSYSDLPRHQYLHWIFPIIIVIAVMVI